MPRTGRPKLVTPRDQALYIRLTSEEQAAIHAYAARHHVTITQTLVEGFKMLIESENTAAETAKITK